jgi:hypothetical protein
MWAGWIFSSDKYIKVPLAYEIVDNELNKVGDQRIFHLPYFIGANINYSWKYFGEEPSLYLYQRPSISEVTSIDLQDKFYKHLEKYLDSRNFPKILKTMNVGSLILHEDVMVGPYHPFDFAQNKEYLNKWKGIIPFKKIGELQIYNIEGQGVGWIYLGKKIYTEKSEEHIFERILSDDFEPSADLVVFEKDKGIKDKTSPYLPEMFVKKISRSHYVIDIKNSKGSFVLVNANRFNKLWIARNKEDIFDNHFQVNGYANGWLIDKTGDFTLEVVFKIWPWE